MTNPIFSYDSIFSHNHISVLYVVYNLVIDMKILMSRNKLQTVMKYFNAILTFINTLFYCDYKWHKCLLKMRP